MKRICRVPRMLDDELRCEECNDYERPQPRVRGLPGEPTQRERDNHAMTHLPYKSWCRICVAARGVAHPHG